MTRQNGSAARIPRSSRSRSSACAAASPAPTTSTSSGTTSPAGSSRSPCSAARTCAQPASLTTSRNSRATSTRRPLLEAVDEFDAEFFGFSARDASLTDPQHRLFLETAWEALEDAGYDPATYRRRHRAVRRLRAQQLPLPALPEQGQLGYLDGMQLMVTNDKDHLCTQVSYRLDLRGPSVVVQTTCSTSLVAVSLACESLQAGQLRHRARRRRDRPRAAARRLLLHRRARSSRPDGHCRPFDAERAGHGRRQRRRARGSASG